MFQKNILATKSWIRNNFILLIGWTIVLFLAILFRTIALSQFPVGLHNDEAWFGYNAFLLLDNGTNIYDEPWPISVDMFGDNVSAMQAYLTIPSIILFGLSTWSVRITVVFYSILSIILGSILFYKLTHKSWLTLAFALLFSISPWHIIMTRASSTVIIDTAALLAFLVLFSVSLEKVFNLKSFSWKKQPWLWLIGSYLMSTIAYFTYFTSRLLIIPMGLGLLLLFIFKKYRSLILAKNNSHLKIIKSILPNFGISLLPLILYFIVPFLVMLPTPFALGRFEQTTVLGSDVVKTEIFENIARSGQAGVPPLIARAIYNKVTINFTQFLQHYLGLLSPNVLLFQSGPPARYALPGVGVVSWIEFFGIISAVGVLIAGSSKNETSVSKRVLAALFLFWIAIAAVPSSLTLDDFPNLQRAVVITPFLQMAAILGLWQLYKQFIPFNKNLKRHSKIIFTLCVGILSVPSILSLFLGYKVHARFDEPYLRQGAGETVSKWINQNAHDKKLLIDNRDGIFFFPYFFNQENMLDQPITKGGKYYEKTFQIGNRYFVSDLCNKEEIITLDYDILILYSFASCKPPVWMKQVYSAKYANGNEGFAVLEPDIKIREEFRKRLYEEKESEDKLTPNIVLKEAWQSE